MKVLVFVINGLILKHSNTLNTTIKRLDENLTNVYVYWNQMYLYSRHDNFSETMLIEFKVYMIYSIIVIISYSIILLIYCIFTIVFN